MGTRALSLRGNKGGEDHPHAYGDKYIKISIDLCVLGSSPRVWGQVFDKAGNVYGTRIIPTRMGTRYD